MKLTRHLKLLLKLLPRPALMLGLLFITPLSLATNQAVERTALPLPPVSSEAPPSIIQDTDQFSEQEWQSHTVKIPKMVL